MTKWNQILEDAIIGKVVTAMIDDGFRVEMSDQDGGGLFLYGMPDNGKMPSDGAKYWVRFVSGNGVDMIVDYTVNLEYIIKPVSDFISQFD